MSVRSIFLIAISLVLSSCFGMGDRSPAPVIHYGQYAGAGSAGVHYVSSGETLYSISNIYNIAMRDIAIFNNIRAPFILYEGQRLKLPPPREYVVKLGDTLYRISRMFDVNSSEIVKINNLKSPYILNVGQVLRIPFIGRNSDKTKIAVRKLDRSGNDNNNNINININSHVASSRVEIGRNNKENNKVPIPQYKPNIYKKPKSINISKVNRKAPRRASSKFLRPVRGRVLSSYGAKKSGLHNDGINIAAPRGTPVKVAENGVVVYAGNALKGSGNLILVRHENQWMTAYAHLDKISVKKGQIVNRGSIIGNVGSTGSVSSPQLHFEIRRGTTALNPVKYME